MPFPLLALFSGGMWKWILIGLAVAAFVGTVLYAKKQYDDGKRREGAAAQIKIMQPIIDRVTAERDVHMANLGLAIKVNESLIEVNKKIQLLYKEQEDACIGVADEAKSAQAETAKVLARVAAQTKSHDARIVELLKRARRPATPGVNVCAEADAIARAVLRERVRNR